MVLHIKTQLSVCQHIQALIRMYAHHVHSELLNLLILPRILHSLLEIRHYLLKLLLSEHIIPRPRRIKVINQRILRLIRRTVKSVAVCKIIKYLEIGDIIEYTLVLFRIVVYVLEQCLIGMKVRAFKHR